MQIIGHRGLMGLAPENSEASFKLAVAKGVDWVEFDVQVSADGHGVVIHDEDLARLANDERKVADMPLAGLKQLELMSGAKLLSLDDALDVLQPAVPIMIELKSIAAAHVVAKAVVDRKLDPKQTIVSSFDVHALAQFHTLAPNIPAAKLRRWYPFVSRRMITNLGLKYVGLRHNWAFAVFIKPLQTKGLKVYAYTIDSPRRLHKLNKIGLDMVVRNEIR